MPLPDLTRLNSSIVHEDIREKWIRSCGVRPNFKEFKRMRSDDKDNCLYLLANIADGDLEEVIIAYEMCLSLTIHIIDIVDCLWQGTSYLSAYREIDIDDFNHQNNEHCIMKRFGTGRKLQDSIPTKCHSVYFLNGKCKQKVLVLCQSTIPSLVSFVNMHTTEKTFTFCTSLMGGMSKIHKASTFGLYLPKKARKYEHFGSRGAPHLSPLSPNVTLSG